jgi:hypothetical protein
MRPRPPHKVGTILLLAAGRLLRVRPCSACGALVPAIGEAQHAEWHRAERERLDVVHKAAVDEAVAKAVPATLTHVDVAAWR